MCEKRAGSPLRCEGGAKQALGGRGNRSKREGRENGKGLTAIVALFLKQKKHSLSTGSKKSRPEMKADSEIFRRKPAADVELINGAHKGGGLDDVVTGAKCSSFGGIFVFFAPKHRKNFFGERAAAARPPLLPLRHCRPGKQVLTRHHFGRAWFLEKTDH